MRKDGETLNPKNSNENGRLSFDPSQTGILIEKNHGSAKDREDGGGARAGRHSSLLAEVLFIL